MSAAERSYIIPVWNGVLAHRRRIGAAIWVFMWCIDRTTREENGDGYVLGGKVLTATRIGNECDGESERNVRRHLDHLEALGYIRIDRRPHGIVLTVRKSKKFWNSDRTKLSTCNGDVTRTARPDKNVPHSQILSGQTGQKCPSLTNFVRSNKEEKAVDLAVDYAVEKTTEAFSLKTPKPHPEKQLLHCETVAANPNCPTCRGMGLIFVTVAGMKRPRPCSCRVASQPKTPAQAECTEKPEAMAVGA